MAASSKHLSFLCLFVFFFFLQSHARESKFFNKFTHYTTNKVNYIDIPAAAPAPTPTSDEPESSNGYGLYGHNSERFLPSTTSAAATSTRAGRSENEMLKEDFNEDVSNSYGNNNYNAKGYSYNNGYTGNFYNNGYRREKQGMSDTRFMENGRYYYNLKNEDVYQNGYEQERMSGTNGGYYGNNDNPNEFDSMEEYERQEYRKSPGGYAP